MRPVVLRFLPFVVVVVFVVLPLRLSRKSATLMLNKAQAVASSTNGHERSTIVREPGGESQVVAFPRRALCLRS